MAPPSTGRTGWDFLTELLHLLYRIGPATIVVGGFLAFAFLFFQEVNKARTEADAQLQQRLVTAQEHLIDTYDKIGGMSDQLIANVGSLLKLSVEINEQIDQTEAEAGQARVEASQGGGRPGQEGGRPGQGGGRAGHRREKDYK